LLFTLIPGTGLASGLERIIAQGHIRVGTAGDYKPFTYPDPASQKFGGIDIDNGWDLQVLLR